MRSKKHDTPDLSTLAYGKIPPQDTAIESAILGAIMLDNSAFAVVNSYLFAAAFYSNANQLVYAAMLALYDQNKPIDLLTVVAKLREMEQLDAVGGPYYVTKTTNDVTSSANIEAHCKQVLELHLKREGIRISGEFMSECYEDSSDAFDIFNKADNSIIVAQEAVLKGTMKTMEYFAKKTYDEYGAVKETGVLGISTGIKWLDLTIGGLVSPDLIIIAARPGAGKTALALSIIHYVTVKCDVPCAMFSLEMDGVQLTRRLLSQHTGINHEDIRKGTVPSHKEVEMMMGIDVISRAKIFIEDSAAFNIRDIRTKATVLKRRQGIKYVIVDYLQLMKGVDEKGKSREAIISEISRGLKMLAKELEIPVIALSQLSREVEKRPDKMPQLSDLRESGAIEQDADCVLFLMRPDYYGMMESIEICGQEYSTRSLCVGKVAKNRHGDTKNIPMWFEGATMTIGNHPEDGVNTFGQLPQYNQQNNVSSALPPPRSTPRMPYSDGEVEDYGDKPF